MGKRKHKTTDPDKIRKKIRRLERRLMDNNSSLDGYGSDDSHSVQSHELPGEGRDKTPFEEIVVSEPNIIQQNNTDPGPDNQSKKTEETLSTDILEALGKPKDKVETFAPKVRDEISERWGRIAVEGLSRESIQELMDNILFPENLKLLKAPELNAEIMPVLSESTRNRDKRLERAQNHLGKSIAAVTNLMSHLIEDEWRDVNKTEIIKKLSIIGQLLLDLHCQNTLSRRKLIMFCLDKKFSNIIIGVKRDHYLFGENLGDKIRANKTAVLSGLEIKRSFTSSSYRANAPNNRQGNSKAPPKTQYRDTGYQKGKRGGAKNPVPSQTTRRAPAGGERPRQSNYQSNYKPHFKR